MKLLAILLCLATTVHAQKMYVKVLERKVKGQPFTQILPGFTTRTSNASANCGVYGNGVNCNGSSNGTSLSIPARTISGELDHVQMLLLLPDGRRVGVYCNDHYGSFNKNKFHACANPYMDDLEANFSGKNVKLTWFVGIDQKKTQSETYIVGPVFPATSQSQPSPASPSSSSQTSLGSSR